MILYKDNIKSAFHRKSYHLDISAIHSYVLLDWLVIAVGLIFSGRNSQS